jgi:hypothetical protein
MSCSRNLLEGVAVIVPGYYLIGSNDMVNVIEL